MLAKSPSTHGEAEEFFDVRRELIVDCAKQQQEQLDGLVRLIAKCKDETRKYQDQQTKLSADILSCRAVLEQEKTRSDSVGDGVGHAMTITARSNGYVKHGDQRTEELLQMGGDVRNMFVRLRKHKADADDHLLNLMKTRHMHERARMEQKLLAQQLRCVYEEKELYRAIMHGGKDETHGEGEDDGAKGMGSTKSPPRKKGRK